MGSPWKHAWVVHAVMASLACVLLQNIQVTYAAGFFGHEWETGTASLIHPHIGFLLAVAMYAADRRILASCFASLYGGWLLRVRLDDQLQSLHAMAVGADMIVLWWWTRQCASWLGGPFRTFKQFSVQDVPRFVVVGLVAFPLGWSLVVSVMHVLVGHGTEIITNEAVQQLLAKHVGVGLLTLPVLLFWTDTRLHALPWQRMAMALLWLASGVSLAWLLEVQASAGRLHWLSWVYEYRLTAGAVLAAALLLLRAEWSMPLLTLAHLVFLREMTVGAQASRDLQDVGLLLFHAFEFNFMSLMLLVLFLVNRERRQTLRRVARMGRCDGTTHLPNARALQEAWAALAAPPAQVGFVVLDHVDRLLGSFGWRAQTAMLRDVARQLSSVSRCFYMGGGQFVLLPLEGGREGRSTDWADALHRVQDHTFSWHDTQLKSSPYLGLAIPAGLGPARLDECLTDACEAALQARRHGEHGPVSLPAWDDAADPIDARRTRLSAASEALGCIRTGRLELHVQPIRRLDGNEASGMFHGEVLCRLRAPNGELLLPAAFMRELEEDGHVAELDAAVVEVLFAWLREHPQAHARIGRLGINLSGLSLSSDSFRDRLCELLRDPPIPHRALCFELTETAVIARFASALRLFEELRDKGCRLALDDFGTGMQSFERLKQLPLDTLKIDGQFVRQLVTHESDRQLVRATVVVARAYRLITVAEYVEDAATQACLRRLGVEWGQGFHLGRPAPLADWLLADARTG